MNVTIFSTRGASWFQRGGQEEGTHVENGALARVQHSQGLIFAGGEDLGAVSVPAGAVDEVSVNAVDPHHGLPAGHVPQDHHVIAACGVKAGTRSVHLIC